MRYTSDEVLGALAAVFDAPTGDPDLRADLARCLKATPDPDRALLLAWSYGYSFTELATRLGSSRRTVRRRFHEALHRLTSSMNGDR